MLLGLEGGGEGAAFAPAGATVAGAAADDASLAADGTGATGLVGLDLTDDVRSHLLEFVEELLGGKFAALDATEFLLPETG